MAYKIAVGSSDGESVDLTFGEVDEFLIYEVNGKSYRKVEKRKYVDKGSRKNDLCDASADSRGSCCTTAGSCGTSADTCGTSAGSCGTSAGSCGTSAGSCKGSRGCSSPADVATKVSLIDDCRCVVCKKIGFQAQKQFEKKAISVFDVECSINEALDKITFYYDKLDNGKSLRVARGKGIL